ncbi:hypothetical protein BJY21_003151 [Kineosphaera limosa]|uniref:Coenzyme Q-binding protein COQ10 START domain-containing protein n=1 Tax=Kineosphaera limosa NBRC 100340 TaxID=1184609 RepID=K6WFR7_9MICO|nr:DUF2505 domain-containing protein [Kineosphaera limosa]NYE01967.1 hypothetical protein [Kineosphaera limosa]GAB98140.1 hypothetical protein KILIM_103_00050 [Kineosphaera limosa NBRC 100340]
MSSHRTLSWEFDGSPQQVLTRCADPRIAAARATADPNLQAEVTELLTDSPDGAALIVTMVGQIPSGWLPSRVADKMGEHGGGPSITRREAWYLADDGSAFADVRFAFQGVPATTMTGSARLAPAGPDRSALTYQLDLDVAIPLLGSMIEAAVLKNVVAAFDKEAHVIASA